MVEAPLGLLHCSWRCDALSAASLVDAAAAECPAAEAVVALLATGWWTAAVAALVG